MLEKSSKIGYQNLPTTTHHLTQISHTHCKSELHYQNLCRQLLSKVQTKNISFYRRLSRKKISCKLNLNYNIVIEFESNNIPSKNNCQSLCQIRSEKISHGFCFWHVALEKYIIFP